MLRNSQLHKGINPLENNSVALISVLGKELPFFITDKQLNITFFSQSAYELTANTTQNFLGKKSFEVFDGLMKNSEADSLSFVYNQSRIKAKKIDIENGNLLFILTKENPKTKSVNALQLADLGFWEWDLESDAFRGSSELFRILELDEKSALSTFQTFISKVHPEDKELLKKAIEEAIQSETIFNTEHRILTETGAVKWILSKGKVSVDESGKVVGLAAVCQDITDFILKKNSFSEHQQFLKLITNATDYILYDYNIETGEILWQGAITKITGFSTSEFSDFGVSEWEKIIHPDDYKEATGSLKLSLLKGDIYSVNYRLRKKDLTYCYISDSGLFIKNQQGVPYRMVGCMKSSEVSRVANGSEERYRTVLSSLNIGIWVQAADSRIIMANQAAANIFGLSIENFIGKYTKDITNYSIVDEHGKEFPFEKRPFVQCIHTKKAVENIIVGVLRENDPAIKWLMVSCHPYLDENGNVTEIVSTLIDITEQRKTEQAFQKIAVGVSSSTGENYFSQLVNFLATTLEVDYAYVGEVNENTGSISTLAAFFNGHHIDNFEYPYKGGPCEDTLLNPSHCYLPNNVKEIYQNETLIALKVESYLGTPLIDSEGKVKGILAVMNTKEIKNATIALNILKVFANRASAELERLKSEKEKSELIEKLMQQNKELQEFSYVLSHTVRAPVATLLGLTSIFDRKESTSELNKEILGKVELVSGQLDKIIKDLNDSLAMRANCDFREEILFADIISTVLKELSSQIEKKQANVLFDFSAAPSIFSIKKYIQNIVHALVDNSLKFSKDYKRPEIHIKTYNLQEFTVITVKDNGLGIDLEKYKNQLFKMYKRFHLHIEGKGLGLYQVKAQVNSLDGKIEIKSEVNKGTEVNIYIPN